MAVGESSRKLDVVNASHREEMRERLRGLPMASLKDGKSLVELTEYEGTTLWWFVHTFFIRAMDRILPSANAGRRAPSPLLRLLRRSPLLSWAYFAYELFASRLGRWVSADRTGGGGEWKILMVSQNHQWKLVRDSTTGERRKGDAFLDSIISALQERGDYEILTTYPLGGPPDPWYFPILGLRTIGEKRQELQGVVHRPFEVFWSPPFWGHGLRARHHFAGVLEERWAEIFRYLSGDRGYDFDRLEDLLTYHFTTTFPRVVEHIETAKRLLERERPDLILLITEYGLFERALVVAAKLKGIPTLAIQHGVISPQHPGYIYPPGAVAEDGSGTPPYVPIPDRIAVYGEYHREILTTPGSYPSESVMVTGQPRYDVLARVGELYDKAGIREELGLPGDARLVLWVTQTHGLPAEESEGNLEAVYGAMGDIRNAALVVKLHPLEDQRAALYRRDRGYTPVIVDGRADTIALLYACDVMITRHSTTALEAVALHKPVIILNLSGGPDPVDYVEQGVAVGVHRAQDLKAAVQRLLRDDADLAANRELYIQRHLYRVDGRAAARITELMGEMIEASKRPSTAQMSR